MTYFVLPVTPTDDITCSLCNGVNVASVKLSLYHVTQQSYQRFIQKSLRNETKNVLSKQNMDGATARPQHVWRLMVALQGHFVKLVSNITSYFH